MMHVAKARAGYCSPDVSIGHRAPRFDGERRPDPRHDIIIAPSEFNDMRIGFMLPTTLALHGPGDGVRVQGWRQAEALRELGHDVVLLNPWEALAPPHSVKSLDMVQFFIGGPQYWGLEGAKPHMVQRLAFAPIIDSNTPNWRYRIAAAIGARRGRSGPLMGSYHWHYRQQALVSDLTIARSQHERDRVIYGLGIDRSKVRIVLNGTNTPSAADPDAVRKKLKLPQEFILHVSAYTQPRKNVVRLLEAVGPLGYPIVIGGSSQPGHVFDRIKSLAEQYPQVKLLGYLDDQTLAGLYAACKVFCLPTTHEGTGLVALEAAALGARVVITKMGGPPDYFLDFAEYVDPYDIDDIRQAVARVWNAPPSDALRKHVLSNLTWKRSAEQLVDAYRHAGVEG